MHFRSQSGGGDDAEAEAADSSEAWKAARVLKRLALSWEEAVAVGWSPPTEREWLEWAESPAAHSCPLCWVRGGGDGLMVF